MVLLQDVDVRRVEFIIWKVGYCGMYRVRRFQRNQQKFTVAVLWSKYRELVMTALGALKSVWCLRSPDTSMKRVRRIRFNVKLINYFIKALSLLIKTSRNAGILWVFVFILVIVAYVKNGKISDRLVILLIIGSHEDIYDAFVITSR